MPLWLDTRGNATLAIGICDRCRRKFPIGELMGDPNSPGLKVCAADRDLLDPYRLPARQTEDITLRFVRPDEPIPTNPEGFITEDGDDFVITEDGDGYVEFDD